MALQSTVAPTCAQPIEDGALWRVVGWAERLAAVCMLLVLGPFLCATAIVVFYLSGRSPLVAHRRVGLNGHSFWTLKFRTMWAAGGRWEPGLVERIVESPGPMPKSADDPRVTSGFARLLRRYSIDEMPQLIHVVTGEMALVGPRPLTIEELRLHYAAAAPVVLSVRPGISGLWQVRGRSRLSYAARRRLDLMLVRKRTVGLYTYILLRTLPEVVGGRNSW